MSFAQPVAASATRSDTSVTTTGKLASLEALRGIAAVIVVAWHFLWAFDPARLGTVSGFAADRGLPGSVALAPVDGPAAVALFFVLSGFVLPLGFLHSGRTETVVRAAAKRWFRLVCLPLLAVLLSWLLLRAGLYHHREAAAASGSAWLGSFGGADPHHDLQPSLFGALLEGSVLAFVRDPDTYDPMLWTMHHEFLGSFVSFALAIGMTRASTRGALWFLLIAAIIAPFSDPWLIAFIAGTGLAWIASRLPLRLPLPAALLCLATGLYLFGYLEPHGAYAEFAPLLDHGPVRYDRIVLHTTAGLLILLGLLGSARIGDVLNVAPFRLLGRLSFAVYVFHFPLLCTVASALFVRLLPHLPYRATLLAVAALYAPVVFAVAYVGTRVDEAWLVRVNTLARRLIPPAAAG